MVRFACVFPLFVVMTFGCKTELDRDDSLDEGVTKSFLTDDESDAIIEDAAERFTEANKKYSEELTKKVKEAEVLGKKVSKDFEKLHANVDKLSKLDPGKLAKDFKGHTINVVEGYLEEGVKEKNDARDDNLNDDLLIISQTGGAAVMLIGAGLWGVYLKEVSNNDVKLEANEIIDDDLELNKIKKYFREINFKKELDGKITYHGNDENIKNIFRNDIKNLADYQTIILKQQLKNEAVRVLYNNQEVVLDNKTNTFKYKDGEESKKLDLSKIEINTDTFKLELKGGGSEKINFEFMGKYNSVNNTTTKSFAKKYRGPAVVAAGVIINIVGGLASADLGLTSTIDPATREYLKAMDKIEYDILKALAKRKNPTR